MNKIIIIILFLGSACAEINPYRCPDITEQYKPMRHKDAKNLDRKKYKFRKTIPSNDKRADFGSGDHK